MEYSRARTNALYWSKVKEKYNAIRREKYRTDNEYRKHEIARHLKWLSENFNWKLKYAKEKKVSCLKLRFIIFTRDKFTCTYCGRKPPEVSLQIDHIHPKSKGGQNTEINFTTSCKECNLGKGDALLN